MPAHRVGLWVEITHPDTPIGAWSTKRVEMVAELPAGDAEDTGQLDRSPAFHNAVADLEQQIVRDVAAVTPPAGRGGGAW